MNQTNAVHSVRDAWASRPHRRADEAKIAGVAAAIGRRYAIDPVLLRVAFVVTALFSGVGVLLYLLGWLLLPAETHPGRARRGLMSAALTIVLVLLLISGAGALFGGRASGVLAFAVAVGALVLLHRSRAGLGEVPGSSAVPGSSTPADPPAPSTPSPDTPTPGARAPVPSTATDGAEQPAPPAWDPLGTAPFAWDLPEPSAPPGDAPAPRATRFTITPITLGLALLAGGIALAFAPGIAADQLAAVLLGVIGLGLVVGSLLQSGRGLILAAVPLALLTWVLQATPAAGFKVGGSSWDPATAAQVHPRYAVSLGNARLDLTRLHLANGQTVTTHVAVGIGQTHVILPPNVDVQLSCQTQFGQVHCLGRRGSGHPARVSVTDLGPDGPGGGTLILDAQSGIGQIHVRRGS